MDNIQCDVKGSKMTITIDLSKPTSPSSTGKTDIVASTHGNVPVPGAPEWKFGLSVYKSKPKVK